MAGRTLESRQPIAAQAEPRFARSEPYVADARRTVIDPDGNVISGPDPDAPKDVRSKTEVVTDLTKTVSKWQMGAWAVVGGAGLVLAAPAAAVVGGIGVLGNAAEIGIAHGVGENAKKKRLEKQGDLDGKNDEVVNNVIPLRTRRNGAVIDEGPRPIATVTELRRSRIPDAETIYQKAS